MPWFCFIFHILQVPGVSVAEEVAEVRKMLQNEMYMRKAAEEELNKLKSQFGQYMQSGVLFLSLNHIEFIY